MFAGLLKTCRYEGCGLISGLKAAFDEKTLFPSSMLQFEANMKAHHAKILENTQVDHELLWGHP